MIGVTLEFPSDWHIGAALKRECPFVNECILSIHLSCLASLAKCMIVNLLIQLSFSAFNEGESLLYSKYCANFLAQAIIPRVPVFPVLPIHQNFSLSSYRLSSQRCNNIQAINHMLSSNTLWIWPWQSIRAARQNQSSGFG